MAVACRESGGTIRSLYVFSLLESLQQSFVGIISIWQMGKSRCREGKQLSWGHRTSKCQGRHLDYSLLESCVLAALTLQAP